jgi:hypothetical protein
MGNIFEGDFAHRNADLLRALGPPAILPAEDFRVIRTTGVAQRKLATDANLYANIIQCAKRRAP